MDRDIGQTAAVIENVFPDGRDGFRYVDLRQTVAFSKGGDPYIRHTGGKMHVGQAAAFPE